jgi:hypothetical protein
VSRLLQACGRLRGEGPVPAAAGPGDDERSMPSGAGPASGSIRSAGSPEPGRGDQGLIRVETGP